MLNISEEVSHPPSNALVCEQISTRGGHVALGWMIAGLDPRA